MNPYESMLDLKSLPVPKTGCTAHYEGSIDKRGGNADWDWFLYQDAHNEWVLFEHLGPGCIYNFVQHRYPSCDEPEFYFYFDGEEEPRFRIRHSEFGEKYPFTEPLASRYIGPFDHGRGPIRVVRSFVPMPYRKSCKITCNIKLAGNDRSKNEGGWGHVTYHAYESDADITTFSADENDTHEALTALWKNTGTCPHQLEDARQLRCPEMVLEPGESFTIMDEDAAGTIAAIRLTTAVYDPAHLHNLWISCSFDDHAAPDIEAPFGCFFANELGYHSLSYLLAGMNTDCHYYNFYPMHFEHRCRIRITNNGLAPVCLPLIQILWTGEWNDYYRRRGFHYFRSTPYYQRRHTPGADSILAEISGSGHIVGSIITGYGETPDSRADCEGDVRIHINGIRTPQIESDGSESYACYGWGFETPCENNPASGYDGHQHKDWSMHRSLPGDWYPYLSGFRFGIESGGCNDLYMEHSGMIFYYGSDEVLLEQIGAIDFARPETLKAHNYQCESPYAPETLTANFEGDDDDIDVTLTGHYSAAPRCFTVNLPPQTEALILRRVSDQQHGRQKARISVNGTTVTEYPWYFPDSNPHKRWLEDEYIIPAKYLVGQATVTIGITPEAADFDPESRPVWNEFGYRIFARQKA